MTAPATENRFFALLAASQSRPVTLNPIHKMHALMGEMRKSAEAGDIQAWQEKLPRLAGLLKSLPSASLGKLEFEMELKKLELTLLLKAGNQAKEQGESAQREACVAERAGDKQKARELTAQAKKLKSFGEHLHAQLLAKTELQPLD